jgi:SAM-dependent methyltransferase
LESRLNQMGVWRDRPPKPVEELQLTEPDFAARRVADAFLCYREQAGVSQEEAFAEFVRESAYSWANRLFTLRCMEARSLIDEVILQKQVYGGRSLVHYRFAQQNPSACTGEDAGLFAVLREEFGRRAAELPTLFDLQAPAIALRPSVSALKRCIGLLSGTLSLNGQGEATDELFEAGDAPGWAYQFWNAEENKRVFEMVRIEKGAKIEGADLIPATQLYTEPYMVKFLVQNSLGAFWAGMYPGSKLAKDWEYYVRDADRTPPVKPDPPPFDPAKPPNPSTDPWTRPNPKLYVESALATYARTLTVKVIGTEAGGFADLRNQLLDEAAKPALARLTALNQQICDAWNQEWPARRPKLKKRAAEITFLDPACGSGHFLLEAFDLLYGMYAEEGILQTPEQICASVLNNNLFGIDIDERAIQISVAALWMHALERAPHLRPEAVTGLRDHLVAANLSLPKDRAHLEEFILKHPEDADLRPALEAVFRGLADANQLGTLLRIEEPVEQALQRLKEEEDHRTKTALRQSQTKLSFMSEQYVLAVSEARDYDEWKRDLLERLRKHFLQEAAVSDPVQGFFGRDARQGLALFDLLAHRYDIVAANPPYMGSKNMGDVVKKYIEANYRDGKRDLYGAFILRAQQLAGTSAYVAMITLASWLTKDSYIRARTTLMAGGSLQAVFRLGRYAFSDADPPGHPVLFVWQSSAPLPGHRVAVLAIERPMDADKQAALILSKVGSLSPAHFLEQRQLLALPRSIILTGVTAVMLDLLTNRTPLAQSVVLCEPSTTGANERFVRYRWEVVHTGQRWFLMSKGGAHKRWRGLEFYAIDWEQHGRRIKRFPGSYVRNEEQMFQTGLTFTAMSRHGIGFRQMPSGMTFGKAGPGLFPSSWNLELMLGVLNSRFYEHLLRSMNPAASISLGAIGRLPQAPETHRQEIERLVPAAIQIATDDLGPDIRESEFLPQNGNAHRSFMAALSEQMERKLARESALAMLRDQISRLVEASFPLDEESRDVLQRNVLVSDLACVSGLTVFCHDYLSPTAYSTCNSLVPENSVSIAVDDDLLGRIRTLLADELASGSQAEDEADDSAEEDDDDSSSTYNPTYEGRVDAIARAVGIHPLSVCGLARELIQTGRLKDSTMMRGLALDQVSVAVLRLIGHRWPRELESEVPVSDQSAADGIVPITEAASKAALVRRVSDYLNNRFDCAPVTDFAGIVGVTLARWLEREFFAHHVRQFRSRPIAWQIQTDASGRGATPVFSCLIYYHRVAGALTNVRTQYAGTLRISFESELRTLEGLPKLTAEQSARKERLSFWIAELKHFRESIETIEAHGFATAELRRYAIADAGHSLARRWLRRLREELRSGPLPGWQRRAEKEAVHPEFSAWVTDAVEHVDRQCVALAPDPPAPDTADEDLTSTALADGFRGQSASMVRTAAEALCREWQRQFDKALVHPVREQIKAAEEEYKQLEDNVENKVRRKDLKSRVKALRNEIASLSAKSGALAAHIREWRCPEAEKWVEWLATQPLYDEFASLDNRRPVPTTVAEFVNQESQYMPDISDGVRVNIAPLQKAGILARDVLAAKDLDKAIADRAEWRADERRWCRQGVLPQPGWWPESNRTPEQRAQAKENSR